MAYINSTKCIAEHIVSLGYGTLFDGTTGNVFYDNDLMPNIIPRYVVMQNGSLEPPRKHFGDFRYLLMNILYSGSSPQAVKQKLTELRDSLNEHIFVTSNTEFYIVLLSEPIIFKVSDGEFKGSLNIKVTQDKF